jgi:hypothetical protein
MSPPDSHRDGDLVGACDGCWERRTVESVRGGMGDRMIDDKPKAAPQDGRLINLCDEFEVAYWTKKFGVDRARLTEAVTAVGHLAEEVGAYLHGGASGKQGKG